MIVKGEPASGKTTFVRKVCKDWSELHLNEDPVGSEVRDALGPYDLLIPLILRLVKHGATLEDTIKDQIDMDDKQMLTLSYMLKNTGRTVLIMDGLDEYHTNRSRDITKIMRGKTFSHVIITTRPEAARSKEWKTSYKGAKLLGLTDENIKLYVEKFFKESTEKRNDLISHIFRKDSELLELARNVGSLSMICILHADNVPINVMNKEQLYQEYVAYCLSRWEQRKNPEEEKTPRSEILKKHHIILLKFGELAHINWKPYTHDDDDDDDDDVNDGDESSDSEDEDKMELSFTTDQIISVMDEPIEDVLHYGFLYRSHPASRFLNSQFSFQHKTLHEYFLAYFISNTEKELFKQRLYKNRELLYQELSLTRFILHLHMTAKEGLEFTTNIIGSKPDKDLLFVLLKLYRLYQKDESVYQTTFTFNDDRYCYIYQYPCYLIVADRRHEDSLSSYNKDMIRRMNTDNKHKAVTVPLLQTASDQVITCGDPWPDYDFTVYCRADYEVTVTGSAGKLKELFLWNIEKVGDINLDALNDGMEVYILYTNLHGCVGLTKPWMALIPSLTMMRCKLEAGDISVIANTIQACTSPTGAESASPCKLQKLDLSHNSLTGAGADIARIIPLCREIDLSECKLEAGDTSVIADSIQACTSPTGAGSASHCRLHQLDLGGNSLTGAGADIARIIPLCTEINLGRCDLNDEDFRAIVNAITQTHSDRHTSVHDHSTPDRRQIKRFKPASPGPALHIEELWLNRNKFSDVETVRLLFDNLPPSLRRLELYGNKFTEEEKNEIRSLCKDKHPNLILWI